MKFGDKGGEVSGALVSREWVIGELVGRGEVGV